MRTGTTHQSIGELVQADYSSSASHVFSSSVLLSTAVCFGESLCGGSPAATQPSVGADSSFSSSLVWFSSTSGWRLLTSGPALPFSMFSSCFLGSVISSASGISNSRANQFSCSGSTDSRERVGDEQEACQVPPAWVRVPRRHGQSGSLRTSTAQARTPRVHRWSEAWVTGDAVADQAFAIPRRQRRNSANPRKLLKTTFCVAPALETVDQAASQWCRNGSLSPGGRLKLSHLVHKQNLGRR